MRVVKTIIIRQVSLGIMCVTMNFIHNFIDLCGRFQSSEYNVEENLGKNITITLLFFINDWHLHMRAIPGIRGSFMTTESR